MTKEELDNLKATLAKLEYVKNRMCVNLAKPSNATKEKYQMYKDLEEYIKNVKQKIKDNK